MFDESGPADRRFRHRAGSQVADSDGDGGQGGGLRKNFIFYALS